MTRSALRLLVIALPALLAAGCREAPPQAAAPSAPAITMAAAGIRFDAAGPDMAFYAGPNGQFPRADLRNWWLPAYSVDSFSRLDEILPAHVVRRGEASAWRRAAVEPAITYTVPSQFGGGRLSLDAYLDRNPVTGLLIAVGDTVQVERYRYGRTDAQRFTSFSMAKTICALLVGLAVADGAIASIDDPAERYVPALKGSEYGRTPLRHLLTMSSGVRFREEYDGNDDVSRLARATMPGGAGGIAAVQQFNDRYAQPGERWYYASAETEVLGLVLRAAIGRSIADYLSERVWRPIGAESDASWVVDATGQEVTYAYFNAVLRDYARLGRLLADGGRVGDRQVVPAAWLAEMTRAQVSAARTGRWYGYGFQTWIFPENDGSFVLLGVRGQSLFVDPGRRLVMVHTAVRRDSRDPRVAETLALWRGVQAAFPRRRN